MKRILFGLLFTLAGALQAAPITDVKLQNTSASAQTAVPITFGQVFAVGDVKKADVLTGSLAGAAVPLQIDVKATHADGSVRHAIISAVVPKLPTGTTPMQIATGGAASSAAPASFRDAAANANVTLTIAGANYTASLADALAATPASWLAGPVAAEVFADAPLKNAAGAVHPLLTVKYGLRLYPDAKAARVEVIVENNKTFKAASNFTYGVAVDVAGRTVYSKAALTHYHHARWHQYFWTGAAPAVIVHPNAGYLIATKAVSNYEQIAIAEAPLAEFGAALTPDNTGPMKIGTAMADMGSTGGRGDIGPLPNYSVIYLLSADKRARDVMMANADGSGTWPIHLRDENTALPVRTDNDANRLITTHGNLADRGPLPVPRNIPGAPVDVPYSPDIAHNPSLSYLPYLLTGDLFYLEELQFWVVAAPLGTGPEDSGNGAGLLRWHQVRGQAWALRNLGHAAYITPDASPMKGYFVKQLDANVDFYYQAYVIGNPNKLGVYDGSGKLAFQIDASTSSPWQNGFFNWSFGYLYELGFDKALPILQWTGKYPVGRMIDTGYCYIAAAPYILKLRDSDSSPIYDSFAKLYQANYGGDIINGDDNQRKVIPGPKFIDIPCGSQAQADYLTAVHGFTWERGRMMGYSDSVVGYLANIQPSLAVTALSGIPNAVEAWEKFNKRSAKPKYYFNPQWNIIPRNADGSQSVPPLPVTSPPAPTSSLPPPSVPVAGGPTVSGTWSKIGVENDTISVAKDTIVRYRANDVSVFKTVSGSFKATNEFFGRDPLNGVVKVVEKFTPTVELSGKIVVASSTTLKKMTKLLVQVFNPVTRELIRSFDNVAANSKGGFVLEDATLKTKTACAYVVIDATGKALVINLTTII